MAKALGIFSLVLFLASTATAKRRAPEEVPAIVTDKAVYSAPHIRRPQFPARNPGFVEARHPKTKKLLWWIQVYQIKYDPNLERDVQDVFIKTMALDPKSNSLLISDEKSRTYVLSLATREVTREASGDQMVSRSGLRYFKGETDPFTGRVTEYTSGLKPVNKRGLKVVTTYVDGKEQDRVIDSP